MDFDFASFITTETLRTFPGQVLAIVALTQLFKELPTWKFNPNLGYVALVIAVWIQIVTNFLDGIYIKATLAVLNGGIITLVSMKGVEMMKGVGLPKPEGKG